MNCCPESTSDDELQVHLATPVISMMTALKAGICDHAMMGVM